MKASFRTSSNFIPHPSSIILFKGFLVEIYQFNGRSRSLKTLVSQFDTCTIYCLVEIVSGHYTENYGNTRSDPGAGDAARHFTCNVVEVRSLSANNGAKTNYSIKL